MKYASVCSGVEAASLAWMPLGWQAAWFSEIEPFPCAVLKKRYPNVPNLGDMTKIRVENLQNGDQKYYGADGTNVIVSGGVDLLVGGTPCQGFSVAGKQGGLNDDRSVLCLTYIKLLETMHPRWFVWENVPGVFSTNEGNDFKEFIRQIDEIGYHVAWRVLDAQYVRVDGFPRAVPQRRRRVFVVGHLGGWQYPAEVLFEPNCLFRDTPPCRVKGKGFTSDVKRCVGTASRPWDSSGVNPTLNQCNAGSGIIGASNQELFSQNFNGLVQETFASSSHGSYAAAAAGTLKANGGDIGGGSENFATIMNQNQVAATLDTHYGDKQGLEDQHVNAGCPNFVIEKHEQIVCVNGAETPVYNSDGYANTVTANHNVLENVIACNSKKMGLDIGFDVNATLNATDYKEPQIICYENHANDSRIKNMGDVCQTLSLRCGTGGGNLPLVQSVFVKTAKPTQKGDCETYKDTGVMGVCYGVDVYNQQITGDVAGTLTSASGEPNTSGPKVMSRATVRRLLPVECERLMGFPDNHTRIEWKGKPEEDCPDAPRYKACGNSMCVNVMRWIGLRIEIVESKTKQ